METCVQLTDDIIISAIHSVHLAEIITTVACSL